MLPGIPVNLTPNIQKSLDCARKIIKLFRKSPIKNAVLQKHIEIEHHKQLTLLLDCKTRWNSIEVMLDRILSVAVSVKIALNELNFGELVLELDIALPVLKDLLTSLQPVKMAVSSLSASGNNLLASEGKIIYMFNKNVKHKPSLT